MKSRLSRREVLTSALAFAWSAQAGAIDFQKLPVGDIADRVDPWIELIPEAYQRNIAAITARAGGRPVIAVLKNNAYGLGVTEVASILEQVEGVWGFALVQAEDALSLRAAGIRKPILLMARHATGEGEPLARASVTLSAFDDDDPERLDRLARSLGRPVGVHLYVDTGLGRMGRFHTRLGSWLDSLAEAARIEGAFTMLTSDKSFAGEQLRRFREVRTALSRRGLADGLFHAASSAPLLHEPAARLDAVRPGILLHGSPPGAEPDESRLIDLEVAFRLCARVVRLERLPAGTTLGFSRFYKIESPTWIATLPTGWGDGYPSAAENGAVVLAKGRSFKVVNVNSNHTNVLVGSEKKLEVGDAVTLVGPDDPAVTPEGLAKSIGGHNYRQIDLKGYLPKFIR
ncbi:MAG: alanine racemase [Acidobacteriota bacterium]